VLIFTLALRTLIRRRGRMALIGSLVAFGTFLIVLGGTFSISTAEASRASIINNFTGDFIVYSARSRDLPSPFAFTTPLPNIQNSAELRSALDALEGIEAYAFYAQNYGLIQVERAGRKMDLPFIFYAVEPGPYRRVFSNIDVQEGSYFGLADGTSGGPSGQGILISRFQNEEYRKNYGVSLAQGEQVTVLGITEGGVNSVRSSLLGIFEPVHYRNVFNYINFLDAASYSNLYNFTGVSNLPEAFNRGLEAAARDENSLFDLASDAAFGQLDLTTLRSQALSGFTMAAVKLRDHAGVDAAMAGLLAVPGLGIKTARWDAASGFYAQISAALQAFIFIATALIFLVVTLIFMNSLIINVVERTAEIGTMRALGAEKSFVRGVFLAETLILNVSAALVAMAISAVLLALTARSGLPLPETVSQYLIGGGPLALKASPAPFLIALLVVVAVSAIATIYPVRVASSISPLKAMSER
jgi:putative ABC transport system permease protein